ncbi:MAG: hypothetical protein AAFQ13_05110 [Pseudomonadota bacterium]
MSFWTAIVAIVAIGAIASILRSRYNAKAGITEDYMGNQTLTRPDDAEVQAREQAAQEEIAQLKERIAVLERIATDNNSADARERARITSEIEALRSPDEKTDATHPSDTN